MKRESWLPSKHQCICCEHFTADSIEWHCGTRCLKSRAAPTIFFISISSTGEISGDLEINTAPAREGGREGGRPSGNSQPAVRHTPNQAFTMKQEVGMHQLLNHEQSVATEVLQVEHSYCRQDTVKAQLWEKLSRLQKKIKRLQHQEQRTATELKRMEVLVKHLKQENFISEVKMKIMENCFTQFELTVLQ
ncbi:THAP domain-containing protein 5 [Amblyraja radiata]|uniref:THAP domain-containing protein 5 n=1 Tax=Amblyraja radiata TaxID=386614 RepID=UPI001402E34E|nr:THAP domain-containing protein 5 [Amblyraja radiata]